MNRDQSLAQAACADADTTSQPTAATNASGPPSEPILYLHIGLPKAASSYLHGHVFPHLMPGQYLMPGAQNARLPAYRYRRNRYGVRRFSDAFQKHPGFWRDHGDAFLQQFLSPFLRQGRAQRSVLISEEAITRLNHFGIRAMPDAFERGRLRDNLAAFDHRARQLGFARVRILLMIRRQDLLLASSYVQLSRKIIGASQQDFERRVARLLSGPPAGADNTFYPMEYATLHECLTRVLPAEDVCFLPIESMASAFDEFAHTVRRFLNAPAIDTQLNRRPSNTRSMGRDRWALRPLLAFKSRRGRFEITIPPRLTGRGSAIELRADTAETIRRHYAEGNRRIADALALDLGAYGYY
ncbi:hypothetical protein [Salinisphaera sp. LB1]|uniref:hypothetical protein n=1 Tax=Salinisphaera sp. LB1 TaxID=2183911 RepID=UPI000D707814|nr:hypothetical protein [Salinisphaera sp. LB1]AWN17218.1 hypothetical protein SALB1_3024 [Salinisphaera sp. LB1]